MFLTFPPIIFATPTPERNAVPPHAKPDGSVWRNYPWVPTRTWRGAGGEWCDDPACPACSPNIYGWRDVPIRRGGP